ncbi:MAG TPA: diacylglycerol kinase family protein [Hyphomicrobiaceae bacterium]|nr:diacylglycerol kinase family protein [Hyphomicrobiaceae bacterium]
MRVNVVVNARSGTAMTLPKDDLVRSIEQPFVDRGHDVSVRLVAPEDFGRAVDIMTRKDVALLVGGGDGSIRSAARITATRDVPLGILPLGTMNLLARDLEIPLDLAGAADALARSDVKRIDAASVNGSLYLCNALIGLPSIYSTERQKLRGKSFKAKTLGAWRAARAIFSLRHRLQLELDDGRNLSRMRVMSLAVANNRYCDLPSFGLRRPNLDGGHLAVYAARHRSGFSAAIAMARALIGTWRTDPYVSELLTHELRIHANTPYIRVSTDGEVEKLPTPLVFRNHPKALSILAPPRSSVIIPERAHA